MVIYKKMSLFDAPKGALLAHGCNAQGVWGSGIAVPFKKNFPESFISYNRFCLDLLFQNPGKGAVGQALIVKENGQYAGCLVTSVNYGMKKDPPGQIVAQTFLALDDFFGEYFRMKLQGVPIYSNKFNSGLFNVPWEETEKALKYFTELYNIDWVVCEQ